MRSALRVDDRAFFSRECNNCPSTSRSGYPSRRPRRTQKEAEEEEQETE